MQEIMESKEENNNQHEKMLIEKELKFIGALQDFKKHLGGIKENVFKQTLKIFDHCISNLKTFKKDTVQDLEELFGNLDNQIDGIIGENDNIMEEEFFKEEEWIYEEDTEIGYNDEEASFTFGEEV